MTLTFRIPRDLWLTSNRDLPNRGHKARIVRDLQTIATAAARGHEPITGPVTAAWEIRYPKGVSRKADAPNAYPTTKACLDAIVRAGILTDDSSDIVVQQHYRRGPNLSETGWHEVQLTLISQEVPF